MADINAQKKYQKQHNGSYYKLQVGRTLDNKVKRLRRHLKNFPNDTQAAGLWTARVRKPLPADLTSKGRTISARS